MKLFFCHILRMLWAWTLPVRLLFMLIFAIFMSFVYITAVLLSCIFLLKIENPLTYWMHNQWWCFPSRMSTDTLWELDQWEAGKDTWISK